MRRSHGASTSMSGICRPMVNQGQNLWNTRISSWWLWRSHHKMCGEILHKSAKDQYQWYGGLQLKETLQDGRVSNELTNFEKILWAPGGMARQEPNWTSFGRWWFLKVWGSNPQSGFVWEKEQRRSVNHLSWVHFRVCIWSCIGVSFWGTVVWFKMLPACMSVAQTGLLFEICEKRSSS